MAPKTIREVTVRGHTFRIVQLFNPLTAVLLFSILAALQSTLLRERHPASLATRQQRTLHAGNLHTQGFTQAVQDVPGLAPLGAVLQVRGWVHHACHLAKCRRPPPP